MHIPSALTLTLTLLLLPFASTHGGVSNYTVAGTWYSGYDPTAPSSQLNATWLIQRSWSSIDPIFSPLNLSLACNTPGLPAPSSIPIHAGQSISAIYYSWLHTYGPMLVWLAFCEGPCATFNASSARWFKIWEHGLESGSVKSGVWWQQVWANGGFGYESDGSTPWTVRVPEGLKRGEYLIRHEILAIHIEHKPQWYPECAHLSVEGEGEGVPGEEYYAEIPGVWSMDQPEIDIDVYSEENANTYEYKIPGPPVWEG